MTFTLHPQLAADTFLVGSLPLCQILLMNDARCPWLILVPQREGLRDWHDVAKADLEVFHEEVRLVSEKLSALTKADKMNVASLGNMVPQLHIHIIARQTGDFAWPGPVWGVGTAEPYNETDKTHMIQDIKNALKLS